jgi:hypothetical protein
VNDSEHYREIASHALAGFQLIEASLKGYIDDYHDKVRDSLPSGMTYLYSGADVQDAALGRLVSVFAKMNNNKALIEKLQNLQKERDNLAHRALVKLYGPARVTEDFSVQIPILIVLAEQLGLLLSDVLGEHVKLVGKEIPQNATNGL